ncbi:MAG: hypothetical protein ABEK36_02395 [Candidatus Aenigmatarchaeota archaeon]
MKSSASMWIWVIGGILIGSIIFTISYSQLIATSSRISEQRILEQYGELGNRINDLCWSFVGNEREYKIVINRDTKLVYLSVDEDYVPKNITNLIKENKKSKGNKICVLLGNSRPRCKDLECSAEMTYIGAVPPEESLMAMVKRMMGSEIKYEYTLHLSKKTNRKVEIKTKKE